MVDQPVRQGHLRADADQYGRRRRLRLAPAARLRRIRHALQSDGLARGSRRIVAALAERGELALRRRRRQPLPPSAEAVYLGTVTGLFGYFVSSMFSSGALLETSYLVAAASLATGLVLKRAGNAQRDTVSLELNDSMSPLIDTLYPVAAVAVGRRTASH